MKHLALSAALLLAPSLASAQQPPAEGESPPQARVTQSEVELISAGRGPQRQLRHRFAAGQRARIRLRIDSQMRVQAGERDQEVDAPVQILDIDVGPSTMSGRNISLPVRLVAASVDGGDEQARASMSEQIQSLVSSHGVLVVNPRGQVVTFDFQVPSTASRQATALAQPLTQNLGQLLPRFPEEAVGPGAQWRIRDSMSMPNMQVEIATVYRLRVWDGDRIELQVRVESGREPATQAMAMTVEGSGRQRYVLGTLQTRARLRTHAEIQARGPNGAMQLTLRSHNEIEPRR